MPIKMKNLPVTERPYEKLEQYGEKNLTNAELLAIIIKSGTREETSVQLAQKILLLNENRDKNNLNFLRDITIEELISQDFKINANSIEEAISIAKEKYNGGKFVLAPGTLIAKQMQAKNEDSTEITEWTEF